MGTAVAGKKRVMRLGTRTSLVSIEENSTAYLVTTSVLLLAKR